MSDGPNVMLPGAWQWLTPQLTPSHSRSPSPHQCWTEETFIGSDEAEAALCRDRSAFLRRHDIMALIPNYTKKRVIHPDATAHIQGFQELFVYLNNNGCPRRLRQLVEAYFHDCPSLRPHLKRAGARSKSYEGPPVVLPSIPIPSSGIPPPGDGTRRAHPIPATEPAETTRTHFSNLAKLNVVPAAAYNSYDTSQRTSCFEGTRAQLMDEIMCWMNCENQTKSTYILYGIAGIGKSTVAKTLAEHAAKSHTLGASFFFSRDEDNRKTARWFFPVLAYHLSRYNLDYARRISDALEQDPDTSGLGMRAQLESLIAKPLGPVMKEGKPILIVVDALDECDEGGAEAVLTLLADYIPQMPRLRVFITARPEPHIQSALGECRQYEQVYMQDIELSVVKDDIQRYLEFRLSENEVKKAFPKLRPPIWRPTKEQMSILVGLSGKLFIIASTAASFILDRKHMAPAERTAILLDGISPTDFSGSKHTTIMDDVYTRILYAAQPDPIDGWINRFQMFVGTVVVLHDPLPCDALAILLGVDVNDIIRTLSNLQSLLGPSENETYRVHHKSFVDFICDNDRCKMGLGFHISPAKHHMRVAECCLRVMNKTLTFNICNLNHDEQHRDVAQLRNTSQAPIPTHLAYACTHWVSHLVAGLRGDVELNKQMNELFEQFATQHLLHWMEALSFIGRADVACSSLDAINTVMKRAQHCKMAGAVQELLYDGFRFIHRNLEIVRHYPMHLYYSALPFTPCSTASFRTYSSPHARKIKVVRGTERGWDPLITVLRGHSSCVRLVAFSGGYSRLASASDDRTVRLWDAKTGAHIATLEGHSDWVYSVAFSADGSRLASASDDKTVRLWEGKWGAHIATLEGHSDCVRSVAFSADSSRLASASHDKTVRLWDGITGAHIAVLEGHSNWVSSIAFSANASRLASASTDKTIRLWDGKTGARIAALEGHSNAVNSVAFSADGVRLASVSDDRTVRLWECKAGAHISTLKGHSALIHSVAFSTDDSRLASASNDKTIRLWDGNTGALIATLQGHSDGVCSISFSADSSRLASASLDRTVRLWDGKMGTHIATFKGHSSYATSVAFSADDSRLASGSIDGTVRLWDSRAGAHIAAVWGHSDVVDSVAFSADGSRLASASIDNTVQLWDGKTGTHISILSGHSDSVSCVSFSADGARLASGSWDNRVQLWDGKMGAHIATLTGHSQFVSSVAFSPDGSRLVSRSYDKMVRLWDGETGTRIAICEEHSGLDCSVEFSADSSRLASVSRGITVQLWDGKTGARIATLMGHSGSVNSIIFSAGCSLLASASRDKTIRLWNGRTGCPIATLVGHSGAVNSATFSADDSLLASASDDATVRLWDVKTGAHIATLEGHSEPVYSAIFATDGSALASTSARMVRLWDRKTFSRVPIKTRASLPPLLAPLPLFSFVYPPFQSTRSDLCLPALICELDVIDSGNPPFFLFPCDLSPNCLAEHPGGSLLAIGCHDGQVLFVDVSMVFP